MGFGCADQLITLVIARAANGGDLRVFAEGIVQLIFDMPDSSGNTLNKQFRDSMNSCLDKMEQEKDSITGIIMASAKKRPL